MRSESPWISTRGAGPKSSAETAAGSASAAPSKPSMVALNSAGASEVRRAWNKQRAVVGILWRAVDVAKADVPEIVREAVPGFEFWAGGEFAGAPKTNHKHASAKEIM